MFEGGIDTPDKFGSLLDYAHAIGADEITARKVNRPMHTHNDDVARWVYDHSLTDIHFEEIENYMNTIGIVRERYPFGGVVYNADAFGGMNICLTNSLTKSQPGYARQLIFHFNGDIATDWSDDAQLLP